MIFFGICKFRIEERIQQQNIKSRRSVDIRGREGKRVYSCSSIAMIWGSSFLMSYGYHWATFSPINFLRKILWADFWPVGLSMCPNILALASVTPVVIAVDNRLFRPPVAISLHLSNSKNTLSVFDKKNASKTSHNVKFKSFKVTKQCQAI